MEGGRKPEISQKRWIDSVKEWLNEAIQIDGIDWNKFYMIGIYGLK